jgi:leader peptidase (prepilin peptidase)/N-methyltransferase
MLGDPAVVQITLFALLLACCAAIVVIDMRHRIIPDMLNLAVALLGLGYAVLRFGEDARGAAASGLIAAGVVWGVRYGYYRWRGVEGLGLGDVKLFGAAGIWTGLTSLPFMILMATGSALLAALAQRLMGRDVTVQSSLPFGPFIAFGLLLTVALEMWA